jgi:cytochrome c556
MEFRMTPMTKIPFATAVLGMIATVAIGADHIDPAVGAAIKARQSHMQLFAFNLGTLGGMAQGKIEYDADAAQIAASNLDALASVDFHPYFVVGSSSADASDTRALPAIWEDPEGVLAALAKLQGATAERAGSAGGGLEGLQAAMSALGGACGACHQAYRAPAN